MTRIGMAGRIGLAAAAAVCAAGLCFGEDASERPQTPPRWGTKDRIFTHIGFSEFTPDNSSVTYSRGTNGRYSTTQGGLFAAVAHVPSGALLTYLELDYCDTNAAVDVRLDLYDCNYQGTNCGTPLAQLFSSDGGQGCQFLTADLSPLNYTMDNNSRELVLFGVTYAGDDTTQLNGAYIGYKLQISEAPPVATFGDVPTTHTYFRAIEALAASGITGGCGNGNFCPQNNVTRGEMAAFLARALGLHFPN
jgi:S-layer homology domain